MIATTAKITVGQVKQWFERGSLFMVIDARNVVAWGVSKVKARGAIRWRQEDLDRRMATLPRDQWLVVYCTCPGEVSSARVAPEVIEHELDLARRVQEALSPAALPVIPGIRLAAMNRPARIVSGDLYDVVRVDPERIILLCADSRLQYVNAGHNPPLLLVPGVPPEELTIGGPPVGLLDDSTYSVGTVVLPPGAMVLVYTDGVIDAVTRDGEEFGLSRLLDGCAEAGRNADAMVSHIEEMVTVWSEGADQMDDITLVALSRAD